VECKLGWVNFRSVLDHRRPFRPALGVIDISHDWYRTTMGVIVIGVGIPRSAGENVGCTWEHLRAPATSLGVPTTCLRAPRITVEQSGK